MIQLKQLFRKINGVTQPFYPLTHEEAIFDGGGRKLSEKLLTYEENISDAFSETKAYAIGEYVIYENRLYKFTSAKEAGPFDGTKVVPCSVMGEMDRYKDIEQYHIELRKDGIGIPNAGTIETPEVEIPSTGVWLFGISFSFCGASSITKNGAFVNCRIYVDGNLTSFEVSRKYVNIPISASWDNASPVMTIRKLLKGNAVKLEVLNETGLGTSSTYNSTLYATAYRII